MPPGFIFTHSVFIAPGFVTLVVNMVVFLLQVELDPVVQAHNLLPLLGLSDKHMLKTTGILPVCTTNDEEKSVQKSFKLSFKVLLLMYVTSTYHKQNCINACIS